MHQRHEFLKYSIKVRVLQAIAKVSYYIGLSFLLRIYNEKKNRRVIILMYHRIFDNKNSNIDIDTDYLITPEEFEKQIKYISEKYNVISFDELIEHYQNKSKLPKNSIIITFDDGYKDCYTIAYPILQKYNVSAMFFIATDYINSDDIYWWDKVAYALNNTNITSFSVPEFGAYNLENPVKRLEAKRDICKKLRQINEEDKNKIIHEIEQILKIKFDDVNQDLFLNWDEINDMSQNGMEFGAHTCSHAILTRVPNEHAKYEIRNSKSVIEANINKKINVFSYPSGTINDFNDNIKEYVEYSGFRVAVSTVYGINKLNDETDLYSLKRLDIIESVDIYLFMLELTGILDSVYLIRNKLKKRF
ncbi:MAG: polysaccharide deacetylase family protein [Methanosarcinales archaeon]|nr:polysaccharide deacetylase family protein [Methanosarcinales archaeon]